MIRVQSLGQIGNQMFQYVIGQILAERTGQMHVADQWRNKDGAPLQWSVTPYLRPVTAMGERDGAGPHIIHCEHWFDLASVRPGLAVQATGFFQRYELLRAHKQQIRDSWLKIHADLVPTDNDAVYVHVRRTDYLGDELNPDRNCQATTIDEYAECLKRFPDAKRLVLVSDDYRDPFLEQFAKFGKPVLFADETWDRDFLTLASCRSLIMSQSTFSWWAAFLGRPERIVCPCFPNTFWGKGVGLFGPPRGPFDYPNLFVDDDSPGRWEFITS